MTLRHHVDVNLMVERNTLPDFYDQVMVKLLRLRHTVPFQLRPKEVYEGCLPVNMRHIRPDYPPGRMGNLLSTMHWTGRQDDISILHVSVETEHEYTKSREANGGYKEVFWFRPPTLVAIPPNSRSVPFFMPLDHPLRLEVREWFLQAMRVENDIQFAAQTIDQFSKLSRTPANLAYLWPELMNFIRVPSDARTTPHKDVERMQQQFAKLVDPKGRNKIIDLLTTTVMLQDRDFLPAWVGFHIGGM